MPEPKQPPQTDPPAEPSPEERETHFWNTLDGRLDAWLERKTKEANDQRAREGQSTGTSRTGAKRVTLPSIIADIVFGPPKE